MSYTEGVTFWDRAHSQVLERAVSSSFSRSRAQSRAGTAPAENVPFPRLSPLKVPFPAAPQSRFPELLLTPCDVSAPTSGQLFLIYTSK